MAYKRKIWKRGDKLNAAELNRIEEGIGGNNNSSSTPTVFVDMNIGTGLCSNWSISVAELRQLLENKTRFTLVLNLYQEDQQTNELEQVGIYWADCIQIIDLTASLFVLENGAAIEYLLAINKEDDEDEILLYPRNE